MIYDLTETLLNGLSCVCRIWKTSSSKVERKSWSKTDLNRYCVRKKCKKENMAVYIVRREKILLKVSLLLLKSRYCISTWAGRSLWNVLFLSKNRDYFSLRSEDVKKKVMRFSDSFTCLLKEAAEIWFHLYCFSDMFWKNVHGALTCSFFGLYLLS